jgi:hypothetical protein
LLCSGPLAKVPASAGWPSLRRPRAQSGAAIEAAAARLSILGKRQRGQERPQLSRTGLFYQCAPARPAADRSAGTLALQNIRRDA